MTTDASSGLRPMDDFDGFVRDASRRLRRALVARYGVDLGTEAAADAIAHAWEHREKLALTTNPLGYLYRVGQSSVRRYTRRRRQIDLPPESAADSYDVEHGDVGLPDALAGLKHDQRVAVVLVHAHGYSYAEVADVLNVPVSTVRNHVHRGMIRLRDQLERRHDH